MATFVLVHGAWHGGWCWARVARLLTAAGHDVFAPTLSGLCERSHLRTPDTGLDTHILDVVNEMKWKGLQNVVLVGHSYGGMVISGVAEKMEKSIASFVMLDAFMPENGQAVIDMQPLAAREPILAADARALPHCRRVLLNFLRSTKRTGPGSMPSARHSRSNASCRN